MSTTSDTTSNTTSDTSNRPGSPNETELVVDPQLPTVRIVREFEAPAARVFHAHADPELFARWNGPDSVACRVDAWDFRSGGSFRYACHSEGEEYGFYGSFHEVRPGERLVQTFTFEGFPDGVSLETGTFEDLPDGRSRLTWLSVVDSIEARDAFVASGMETGVVEGYAKLDRLLSDG